MSNFEPGTVAYLQRITEVCGPSTPPRSLEERRDNFDRRCAVWRRPPPDTLEVRDWSVTLPGREVPVRLYRRKDAKNPAVILYLHGGGFVNGSIDTHDTVTWSLAEATGALVVSAHYRRPPENPFPAATDDGLAVLDWIRRSAEFLRADVARVAVAGDSAGGCLAASMALLVRDRGRAPIRMQALLYPCIDTAVDTPAYENNKDPFVSREGMRFYWDKYLEGRIDTLDPIAVPMRAQNLAGLAPAYVMTAEFDPLRVEGEAYAERLLNAGVPTTLRRVPGTIHGLLRARFASPLCQSEFDRLAQSLKSALA